MSIIDILITFSTTTQAQPQVGRDLQLFGNFQDSRQLLIFFSILKIIFYFFATFISFRKEGHLPLSWFILSGDLRGRVFFIKCLSTRQVVSRGMSQLVANPQYLAKSGLFTYETHSNIFCGICVRFKKQNFFRKQSYSVRDQNHEKINFKLKPVKKKQLHFGNFSATFWHLWGKKITTFQQL